MTRGATLALATAAVAAAVAIGLAGRAAPSANASSGCTAAAKAARVAALQAYLRSEPARKASYFKKHPRAADRTRFVHAEAIALRALRTAAACVVPTAPTAPSPSSCSPSLDNSAAPSSLNEGPTNLNIYLKPVGTIRALVLYVDFPDAPATESIPSLTAQVFAPAAVAYTEMSYGKLTLQITAAPEWIHLSSSSTSYGLNNRDGPGRKDAYIADAVHAADPSVDFSKADIVYLVPSAGASDDQAAARTFLAGQGIAVDGIEARHFVFISSDRLSSRPASGPDMVIHETAHHFGLPDLYGDYNAVGGWDPMSFSAQPGAEFVAWHRWKFGWLDATQVSCPKPGETLDVTLAPLETIGGTKAIVVTLSATTLLVIENRQLIGHDSVLCDNGLLLYTVDGSAAYPGRPLRVVPAHSGTDTNSAQLQACGPIYDAPFDLNETAAYDDAAVHLEILSADGSSYRVRVTRK